MANINSRLAQMISIPETAIEAVFRSKMYKPEIAVVIKNPSRAAKILGALSINLTGNLSVLFK
jgi:hypothetical protein